MNETSICAGISHGVLASCPFCRLEIAEYLQSYHTYVLCNHLSQFHNVPSVFEVAEGNLGNLQAEQISIYPLVMCPKSIGESRAWSSDQWERRSKFEAPILRLVYPEFVSLE